MVHDITGATNADITDDTKFSAKAVIDAAAELGDNLSALTAVAMHSDVYRNALKNDLLTTHMDSAGVPFQTFRGLAVIVDDGVPYTAAGGTGDTDTAPEYTSILFGGGAVGYGVTPPRIADGTEVENLPSAGNGGGQQVLHSRVNVGVHPLGFSWLEGSVTDDSPSLAELAKAGNWDRIYDRKHIPLAFLKTNG